MCEKDVMIFSIEEGEVVVRVRLLLRRYSPIGRAPRVDVNNEPLAEW